MEHTRFKVVRKVKQGLETFEILMDDRVLHTFLSERGVRAKFLEIIRKTSID